MQEFTGTEYVMIDVANQFGLDRLSWRDRIHWVQNNRPDLTGLAPQAKKKLAYEKALRALECSVNGDVTNHIMGLDATASGIQFMAAMSGCRSAAAAVNLIDTGKREDVYESVAKTMSALMNSEITRDAVKKPVMTYFYGSEAQPKRVFGEEGYKGFIAAIKQALPGPHELMGLFQSFWDPLATKYTWAMPDGHVVHIPVTSKQDKGLEIDEANHLRLTYRADVVMAQMEGRALAANIVHSVDAWACREVLRQAKAANFYVAPIHDCFYAHPNHMNQVRVMYRDAMAQVAEMNLVEAILSQIAKRRVPFNKLSPALANDIRKAEYCLS